MTARVAGRVVLVVLAAVVVAWLAYDLRALDLDAEGQAAANAARTPAQVNRALSLFKQAARANADPTPRIDEARLLLRQGRKPQAADLLASVTKANPGNLIAWALLIPASSPGDPRHAQATHQLAQLFGHPVGYSTKEETIHIAGGVVDVVPGRVLGSVERVALAGDSAYFTGWALPAGTIVIVANGRVVANALPNVPRPDVAIPAGAPTTMVGFRIGVPVSQLETAGTKAHVEVLGNDRGIASQLGVDCTRPQAFGCS